MRRQDYERFHETRESLEAPDWYYDQKPCRGCGHIYFKDDLNEGEYCNSCFYIHKEEK